MTDIEICFGTVCGHKYFTVFEWTHRPRIDIDVRIDFKHTDIFARMFEQCRNARRCNPLPQ